jgi:hypothetical protein
MNPMISCINKQTLNQITMLFAEKSDQVTLRTYYDLVNQLIEHDDTTYKTLIDNIIIETAKLAANKGESLGKVDSSIYDIVSKLYSTNRTYFADNIKQTIDIDKNTYKSLRDILLSMMYPILRTGVRQS